MTDDRERDSVFLAAIELESAADRKAFLDKACGQDARCRDEVERLLAAHEQAGSFMRDADNFSVTVDRSLPDFEEGTEIGNYKLLQRIGEGGFGTVYMAEQQRPLRRKVALKIVKPGMDSRDVIARFEAERQALALMDHPNIAKVLDAGTTESGRPYFVMELVKGVPVTEYCDKNRLSARERLELFVTLCHAVQHAHQKGVIHRDIKPSNIMVTLHDGKPVPKVIDFGVSKALNQRLTEKTLFTRYGQMIGTPQYMSPEQAEMSGLDVDTRSDIFSLGVVLYELLTGQTPLDSGRLRSAGFAEMQRLIRDEEPPRPSVRLSTLGDELTIVAKDRSVDPGKLRQLIRGELDWIVMKALEKDRGRRYASASSFAEDVERYLGDEPIEACPPSTTYRLRKFARRNKGPVLAGLAVSTAMVTGLIVATLGMISANQARRVAVVEQTRADEEAERASELADKEQRLREEVEARRQDLDETLYAQRIARAYQHVLAHRPIGALKLLDDCPRHLRDWEWSYIKRRCHVSAQRAIDVPGRIRGIDVRASDGKVVVGLHDGKALLFDKLLEARQEIPLWETPPEHFLMQWVRVSPAHDVLAAASGSHSVQLLHAGTRTPFHELDAKRPVVSVAFSPDGKTLAAVGEDDKVKLWDVATGALLATLQGEDKWVWAVCFSPDGRFLAAGSINGAVSVWDIAKGEPRFVQPPHWPQAQHWAPITSLRFSPDSKRLVSASFDLFISIWDPETGERLKSWKAGKSDVSCVAYNPTGTRIASTSEDGTLTIWNAANGRELLVLRVHEQRPRCVEFSHDGHGLLCGGDGGELHVYDGSPWDESLERKPIQLAPFFNSRVLALDIKPDGTELAAGGEDGVVRTWHLPSGKLKKTFPVHGDGAVVFDIDYEPTGPHVISTGGSDDAAIFNATLYWSTQTGGIESPLVKHEREVFCVAVHPKQRRFVLAGYTGGVEVFDFENDRPVNILAGHESAVWHLAFGPKGRFLVSASDEGDIRLWDAEHLDEPQESETLLNRQGIYFLQMGFDPDGQMLALGDGNDVLLYDLETRTESRRLPGHGDAVNAVAFSHNGKIIASGSTDGTVKLWDATTHELLETLLAGGAIYKIAFTPDDQWLASAGEDTDVKLWNLSFLNRQGRHRKSL